MLEMKRVQNGSEFGEPKSFPSYCVSLFFYHQIKTQPNPSLVVASLSFNETGGERNPHYRITTTLLYSSRKYI
ncbi:hypothetical protein QVD17_26818 [Tagetes erecta]|uniref:Uncharacterized protein n=1 Tax=Tagetes erecta TaxID=13708 RepID=A0AAD8K7A6_TARER|nr:hypothetical protein QVD17_26818 [Tagetes erecta]